jgi:hypothetical protein
MLLEREAPGQPQIGSDRGCPLGTVIDRPMWHAGGTAGEDERGTSPRKRQAEGIFGSPPESTWPLFTVDIGALQGVTIASGVVATAVDDARHRLDAKVPVVHSDVAGQRG